MLTVLAIAAAPALAAAPPLEPEIRVHAGAQMADGQTVGGTLGMDSRLTRLIYIETGGFVSPIPLLQDSIGAGDGFAENVFLRHGLYFSPGFRIPHRQGDTLQWDVLPRVGFAAVWFADSNEGALRDDVQVLAAPSGFGGLDALIRSGAVGLKVSGKAFLFNGFDRDREMDVAVVKPMWSASVLYQW